MTIYLPKSTLSLVFNIILEIIGKHMAVNTNR